MVELELELELEEEEEVVVVRSIVVIFFDNSWTGGVVRE